MMLRGNKFDTKNEAATALQALWKGKDLTRVYSACSNQVRDAIKGNRSL